MMKPNKAEMVLSGISMATFVGTIIALVQGNLTVSMGFLLAYVLTTDVLKAYKMAKLEMNQGMNNVVGDVLNSLNLKE